MGVIIGIFVVLCFIIIGFAQKNDEARNKTNTIENENWMKKNGYDFSSACSFLNTNIYIDENKREIVIYLSNSEKRYIIKFDDILGMEIAENGQRKSGIGRAVVGGVLFGEVGAIVGAVTAKTAIDSMKIIFYINSISQPNLTIDLITNAVKTDSTEYKEAFDFAKRIEATVKVILNQNEIKSQTLAAYRVVGQGTAKISKEDELKGYKELLEKRLITQQEYKEKELDLLGYDPEKKAYLEESPSKKEYEAAQSQIDDDVAKFINGLKG